MYYLMTKLQLKNLVSVVRTVIIREKIHIFIFHVKNHWSKPTLAPSVHPTDGERECVYVCGSGINHLRIYVIIRE